MGNEGFEIRKKWGFKPKKNGNLRKGPPNKREFLLETPNFTRFTN